jgi:hypothetical protein
VYKFILKYVFVLLAASLLAACSSAPEHDEAIAQVGDEILYRKNLSDIIPKNTNREDSILLATDYINKWIKQELMIQKADENLTPEQKDVSKELEAYRNSLIIYKYKNELIKQRMDTLVTAAQIETYYQQHPDNFNLNRCIVKAIFVKIPSDIANPTLVKDLIDNTSDENYSELREYCGQYAKKVEISVDNWIDFQTLENNFPIEVNDPETFLRSNQLREMNDSNYYYLVSVLDYKLANDLAPLEFVENNIKNLILNQRKVKFLKDIEENVYTEGVRKNKFRIHNKKTNEE